MGRAFFMPTWQDAPACVTIDVGRPWEGEAMSDEDNQQVYHHAGDNLPAHDHHDEETLSEDRVRAYWRANVRLLAKLLFIWFAVSFGAGILFVEPLNTFTLGGFPLGFWFAQQGAIYVFMVLIFVYAHQMRKIEHHFGVDDDAEDEGGTV